MRRILLLCLLFGAFGSAAAQVVTVKDLKKEQPLISATITSSNPKVSTITNVQGKADIGAFAGSEEIEIRMLGYKTLTTSFAELESDNFTVFMETAQISIDEIVVSANRWNQSIKEVPIKVNTITPEKVAFQNPQTAADMLGVSGEVFIQKSQQGGGSPMIRGFATNRLLYSVDGVRMNTAIFRSGNLQNVISLDPFALDKTEVLFGPGSVIYGSDAIGGVMSFQTLTPQLSASEELLITGNSNIRYATANNENTAHFDVGVGSGKLASVTSFTAYDFDDLEMGTDGPEEYLRPFYVERINETDAVVANDNPQLQTPSGYSQINMMQKLRYKPANNWDVRYGFHYSETSDYARYDRHVRYRDGDPRYGEWYYGPQKWMMNNLSAEHSSENTLYDQMVVRLAQQYFEESRISRDINSPTRERRIEEVDAYSVNLDLNKSIGRRNTLYYGIELVWNDVTSTGINENIVTETATDGAARYPEAEWSSYGIYATDNFKLSEYVQLQAGARYNIYTLDATFDTRFYPFPFTETHMNNGALTGNLGAVFTPTQDWMISANLSTGFRAPNVDDAGKVFDSEPGSVVVPNPDLEAEYAYNADLGITRIIGDFLKVDATGYYTILDNALVRRDYTLNGQDSIMYDGTFSQVQAVQNAAIATVYGIQAGFSLNLESGVGISSRINYQHGEEELDDGSTSPSRHAAPWFGVSRISYTTDKLKLQVYSVYSGGKDFDELPEEEKGKDYIYATDENGNPYSPGWYTLNLKAMYKINDNFTVSSGIENITNQLYRPYSSGIVAPGRNLIISFSAHI